MKHGNSIKQRRCIMILIFAVILLLFVYLIWFLTKGNMNDYDTVAYVNRIPVSYGEYMLHVDETRGETSAYFYENYHVDESVDFWSEKAVFGGENPLEVLKETVLDSVTRMKLEQQLMVEYGIVTAKDITYKSFLKIFQKENLRRKTIIEQGGVVYGPEQYTEIGYYNYLHESRLQELREAMYEESGSTEISDKFMDTLIEERLEEMLEHVEVSTVSGLYDKIQAFSKD